MTYRMRTSPLETILLRLLCPSRGPRPMDLFCPGFESQSRSICSWDMACRDIFDDEIRKIRKHTCMILYGSFMFFLCEKILTRWNGKTSKHLPPWRVHPCSLSITAPRTSPKEWQTDDQCMCVCLSMHLLSNTWEYPIYSSPNSL